MSRITRLVVLVTALMSLFAVLSSSAGAATWHNSGSTTLHATAGAETLSSTGAGFACPSGTFTGTVAATPAIVPLGSWTAVTGTATWTGCTLGVSGYSVECGLSLTASTWVVGPPAVTNGVADVTCGFYLSTARFCHVEGTVQVGYANPVGTTPGRLTITTGGNLTVTNGPAGSCPLGNGDVGHLSEIPFTLTNAAGSPIITRTA